MPYPIPVFPAAIGGTETQAVDGRALHTQLGVRRDFTNWIKDRIAKYGFEAGIDFVAIGSPNLANQKGRGGDRRSRDYHLSLDMAKELAMIENNDQGRALRRYFIDLERRVKSGDVTLAAEIADRAPVEDQRWLAQRVSSTIGRKHFTGMLADHGVHSFGYKACTNAIYGQILGGSADEIRLQRNLKPKTNLRDHMSVEELAATTLAEFAAARKIDREAHYGNHACASACKEASRRIAHVLLTA